MHTVLHGEIDWHHLHCRLRSSARTTCMGALHLSVQASARSSCAGLRGAYCPAEIRRGVEDRIFTLLGECTDTLVAFLAGIAMLLPPRFRTGGRIVTIAEIGHISEDIIHRSDGTIATCKNEKNTYMFHARNSPFFIALLMHSDRVDY